MRQNEYDTRRNPLSRAAQSGGKRCSVVSSFDPGSASSLRAFLATSRNMGLYVVSFSQGSVAYVFCNAEAMRNFQIIYAAQLCTEHLTTCENGLL